MTDEKNTQDNSEEVVTPPPQLRMELLRKPLAGDNAKVYPTDEGWVAEYPDGAVEVLIEAKGLKTEFDRLGLDDNAQPIEGGLVHQHNNKEQRVFQRGEVVGSNITKDLLDSLDMAGLRKIGNVLQVKGTSKEQLANDIAEKVGLNTDNK